MNLIDVLPLGLAALARGLGRSPARLLITVTALQAGGWVRGDDRLMVLTVDLSREGRKIAPATPEHPAYYVPQFLGYHERGEIIKFYERKPADEDEIQNLLVAALAKQNYLVASHEHPPSLIVAFEWGSVAPVYGPRRGVINMAEIRACVLGDSSWYVSNRYADHTEEMMSLTPRHYLRITAYEYHRKRPKGGDVVLWSAHATTDAWGAYLDEVVKPFVALVTPALGRETKPGTAWTAADGRVLMGEPKVLDFPAKSDKLR